MKSVTAARAGRGNTQVASIVVSPALTKRRVTVEVAVSATIRAADSVTYLYDTVNVNPGGGAERGRSTRLDRPTAWRAGIGRSPRPA